MLRISRRIKKSKASTAAVFEVVVKVFVKKLEFNL